MEQNRSLTPKQEKFCLEYLKDGNASRAYRVAYDTSKMKEASINVNASKLLKDTKIALRLKELGEKHAKKNDVTAERIIKELAGIAFFDVQMLYNEDGTLKQITELSSEVTRAIHSTKQRLEKQGQDKEDLAEIKEIRTHDKLKALELLGRTLAMFTDKNQTEVSGELSITFKSAMEKAMK